MSTHHSIENVKLSFWNFTAGNVLSVLTMLITCGALLMKAGQAQSLLESHVLLHAQQAKINEAFISAQHQAALDFNQLRSRVEVTEKDLRLVSLTVVSLQQADIQLTRSLSEIQGKLDLLTLNVDYLRKASDRLPR